MIMTITIKVQNDKYITDLIFSSGSSQTGGLGLGD